jgi:hypothetical protein
MVACTYHSCYFRGRDWEDHGEDLGSRPDGAKSYQKAKCQWIIPVILDIWKTEIRRITIPGQPNQIFHEAPPSSK